MSVVAEEILNQRYQKAESKYKIDVAVPKRRRVAEEFAEKDDLYEAEEMEKKWLAKLANYDDSENDL